MNKYELLSTYFIFDSGLNYEVSYIRQQLFINKVIALCNNNDLNIQKKII